MQNILCIRSDRFGEFILSLPAINLIKTNYPNSQLILLANKPNLELIRGISFIDRFIEYNDVCYSGYKGIKNLISLLKKNLIDCVVILNPKKEFHLAALLAGVKVRVGYDRKLGFCLNQKISDNKSQENKHEVEYNFDLVSLICPKAADQEMKFPIEKQTSIKFLDSFLDLNRDYIVIHPFSSNQAKQLDNSFWQELIEKILNKTSTPIALIGSLEDRNSDFEIPDTDRVKNLIGHLSLKNLACFLNYNCSAFIGLDSGPMHLAATLKLPVVGLFKTTNPKRWGPYATKSLVLQGSCAKDFLEQGEKIYNFLEIL